MERIKRPTLTISVDFDGVLRPLGPNSRRDYDPPVIGTERAIRVLSGNYRLICHTAREDLDFVREWLRDHDMLHRFESVTNRKPRADVYLDDKGLRFESWDQVLRELPVFVQRGH